MRVLITGAGGFIGSHLVEDQLARGRDVTAVDYKVAVLSSLSSNPRLTIVKGDFADQDLMGDYLLDQDVCFHLASAHLETGVSDEYFWKVNVTDTRDFVVRCYEAGVKRFVHCSSVGVYGDIKYPPADEESECHPDVAYEASKLAGETSVMEFANEKGYDLTVVRPAWVYGPRCPRTAKLFKAIEKQRFFYVGDSQTLRHPIYISDMVTAFELAATVELASGEIFIIAGPRAVTLEELANEIADCLGVPKPRLKLPKPLVWTGCYILEIVFSLLSKTPPFTRRSLKFYSDSAAFNIRKANDLLNFQPKIGLIQGIRWTFDWLKTNNS
jgi:nucleoside-diphosphate-sugar epimerase